jgi:hypothetical protein
MSEYEKVSALFSDYDTTYSSLKIELSAGNVPKADTLRCQLHV